MDNTLTIALVGGLGGVIGGLLTTVIGPLVRHRLEERSERRKQKIEQINKWRTMLLDVDRSAEGNIDPNDHLHIHPDYISLEPYLTDAARKIARGSNMRIVVGQALCYPLEILKQEIARIEAEWGLRK